jgi:hypothetical protein
MKIACIGWGSLVWNPGNLLVENKEWFFDGPLLPIEFVRISSDKRVTLVIDEISSPISTLWNIMDTEDLQKAFNSLLEREGTIARRIHTIDCTSKPETKIQKIVQEWLKTKNLDKAIWTGLYLNANTQNARPTISEIIKHLKSLDKHELQKAKEYILRAPKQINTKYRKLIVSEFKWK